MLTFISVVVVVESVDESVHMATLSDPAEMVLLPCSSVANLPMSVGQMTTLSHTSAGDLKCFSFLLKLIVR